MARKSLEKLEQEHSQDQPAPEQPEQEATEDEAAETIADIAKLLLQQEDIRNSRSCKESELYAKATSLEMIAKSGGSTSDAERVCNSAKEDAAALYESTGGTRYAEVAGKFAEFEKILAKQAEFEERLSKMTGSTVTREMPSSGQLSQILHDIDDALATKIQSNAQAISDAIENIAAFLKSETYKAIKENVSRLSETIAEDAEEIETAENEAETEEIRQLIPFIKEELERMKTDPTLQDYSVADILKSSFDAYGNQIESPFWDAIERAKERKVEFEKAQEIMNTVGPLESLSMLRSIIPTKHVMPNSTLMNALQEGIKHDDGSKPAPIINAGPFDMIVSRGKASRKEITAYTMIEYDNGDDGVSITPMQMTEYDRQVSDAVISLYEKAKADGVSAVFTTDMIHRAMPGGGEKASPQQRGAITKAIEKMRKIHVYVDATEEMRRRGLIPEDQELVFDEYYFSISRAQCRNRGGGDPVTAYKITSEPIILNYARLTKQILTIPAKYIEIKKVSGGKTFEPINMTKDRQSITGYLVRQIGWIIYDRKHKVANPRRDTIQFDTVFKAAGVDVTNKQTAKRQRDFIFTVLDYEKAAGFISDYKKLKKGQSIYGVQIIP